MTLQVFKKVFKHKVCFFALSLVLFSFPIPSFSAPEIPSEWARVSKKFEGKNGKTLILIQEAHVDYGAQKAIVEILKSLVRKNSLRLILVEGGWEDMGLSHLRNLAGSEGRLEVAERYLKEGKISAEEYLDIISDFNLALWGIEDSRLYKENMETFLKIYGEQEKLLQELASIETVLNALKEKIFPPSLQELQSQKQSFEQDKISLFDYLKFLNSHLTPSPHPLPLKGGEGKGEGVALSGVLNEFPDLKKLLALSEGEVDAEKAEWEKQNLIRVLSKKITKPELSKLELLNERKSPEEELAFIESLLALYRKNFKPSLLRPSGARNDEFAALENHLAILKEVTGLNPTGVFDQLEQLENKIIEKEPLTDEQKELLKFVRYFAIIRDLLKLQLAPEDFEKLSKSPGDFTLKKWKSYLGEKSREFQTGSSSKANFETLEKWIPVARSFYHSAEKREEALVKNTVAKFEREPDKVAAMIVGGFHAEKLIEALQKKGYSFMLLSPRFIPEGVSERGKYFEALKNRWGSGPIGGTN